MAKSPLAGKVITPPLTVTVLNYVNTATLGIIESMQPCD
jgi:hypothetical protein